MRNQNDLVDLGIAPQMLSVSTAVKAVGADELTILFCYPASFPYQYSFEYRKK